MLAASIVIYDGFVKQTPFGCIAMGGCRFFNVLLGMSVGAITASGGGVLGYDASQWIVAGAIGTYVAGITIFAKTEARDSDTRMLTFGLAVMLIGLLMLSYFPRAGVFASGRALTLSNSAVWPMLVALLGFSVARRCMVAVTSPQPKLIQVAVKQSILSLIVFNAAIVLAVQAPFYWALIVLLLMVPMLVLGRWVYST